MSLFEPPTSIYLNDGIRVFMQRNPKYCVKYISSLIIGHLDLVKFTKNSCGLVFTFFLVNVYFGQIGVLMKSEARLHEYTVLNLWYLQFYEKKLETTPQEFVNFTKTGPR